MQTLLSRSRAIIFGLAVFAFAAPALGQALSAQDHADIARVEQYLNAIATLQARFVQIGPRGELAQGMFYLSRPNRLRFEYDAPAPILVVADGLRLIFYDKELDQENAWPIATTPLAPLLARTVSLTKQVTSVRRDLGVLRLTLIYPDRPGEGSLTLVFSDDPLELRQWTVVDAQVLSTVIALSAVEKNLAVDPDLFFLPDRPQAR